MKWQDYISSDKEVLLGKPTIIGTRLSVDHIVGLLAQGWTEQDLFDNYPRLSKDHLKAIFAYIHDCIKDGLLYAQIRKSA
ncbi:hypothetical protein BH09BAC5_BH09BAC5_00490 [soil metagenome]